MTLSRNIYPLKGKEEIISELQKAAKNADRVYLATDPDREGEAISWHLKYLLSIPDDATYRVTFNEITRGVVQESIQHPRPIDQNLVDAQQARRVLDRIVGYQLSPLLWRKIRKGLSAGRVQSVATRLVVDRENEIRAFQPQEYWTLDVNLSRVGKPGSFTAHYYGDPQEARACQRAGCAGRFWTSCRPAHSRSRASKNPKRSARPRRPSSPRPSSRRRPRKLNMTPRRTMMIAQQLYEGVEIYRRGLRGPYHLHAYRLAAHLGGGAGRCRQTSSAAAMATPTASGEPRRYKPKSGAQDAHEAIRPVERRAVPGDGRARPDEGAVPALQAHLEPLHRLPDGKRPVRRDGHRGRLRQARFPRHAPEHEILRLHRHL